MSAPTAQPSVLHLLTRLFDGGDSLAVVSRLRDGRIAAISPGFLRLFGMPEAEAIGRTAVELGLWPDEGQRNAVIARALQRGSSTGDAVSVRALDGRHYDGLMSCSVITLDGERHLFCLIQDVRSYQDEATARRREFDSLRSLIMDSEVGVYRLRGPAQRLVEANPALAQMLGHASVPALLAAVGADALLDHVDRAHAARLQSLLTERGRYAHVRSRLRRRDGSVLWVSESAHAVRGSDGELLHVDGTLIDIGEQVRAEEALRQSESLYLNLVQNSRDGVFLMQHGRVEFANEALGQILGCSAADLIGNSYFDWVAPEDKLAQQQRRAARESGSDETQVYEIHLLRRDGARRLCEVRAGFVEYRGEPASIGTLRDVSEARTQQRRLAAAEERYRLLFQHAVLGMFQATLDGRLLEANEAMAQMFGYPSPAAMCAEVRHMRDTYADPAARAQAVQELLREGQVVNQELEFKRRDGSRFWALASARLVRREEPGGIEGSLIDISARRAAEQELKFLAHHDSLTGLANRRRFEIDLRETLARLQQGAPGPYAMLLLDLDRFKLVNDSLGHAAGDELLLRFAETLRAEFGASMRIARYGGDEFAMLSQAPLDLAGTIEAARRVQAIAAQPFQVRAHQVFCGASIGIVLVEHGRESPEDLLRDADTAMFRAKAQGGGHALFDSAMHAAARARLALETELRFALARGELLAHYQPVFRLADRAIVGVEALVRWQHPVRGLLAPGAFLGVAEDAGLLPEIDLWMLAQALQQMRRWQATRGERAPARISVNVSDRLFTASEFPALLQRLLADSGVAAAALQLEITESVFRTGAGSLQGLLGQLKALGVGLIVDDFGTGYSSMVSFSEAAFDGLKIDQGFIRDLESNERHRAIVRTIVQFGRDLGLGVVGEGVETEAQARWLHEVGCELAQGYLHARPMDPAALAERF